MRSLSTLGFLIGSLAVSGGYCTADIETRSLDQIHEAAKAEGGVVNLWAGGDEKDQQNGLKEAFETRFPGMTLNVTVDLSKYHDGRIDEQLAANNLYVDATFLQSLHDFPRWKSENALLNYQPLEFKNIFDQFKDSEGAYYGVFIFSWSNIWNTGKVDAASAPKEYTDYLKPVFKDKLALTYPNDDDAVAFQFDLIIKQYGWQWFDDLIAQNPRWVRGTATPATLISSSNGSYAATFTSGIGLTSSGSLNVSFPTQGQFVSWPQTGAIFADAPHPEGAKLLTNFVLSDEYQKASGWSVRRDLPGPSGYPTIFDMPGTNVTAFRDFMLDRAAVERLRFRFEDKIGTAQGLSPLVDDL
ncbi:ABC-type Fe3+ transport system [Lophium mytilinum]|uniref:ABC-type Fe3+ transport system n=1 Tax=Lophium mytilinum TaxID=390894 RepID=A0A6A6R357_9PEZI|nr:ABC-type Fe3+ transport system [Lophium mytilinum]